MWRGSESELRLEGEGRQRILRLGPNGSDEISAGTITVFGDEQRIQLEEEVRGVLYQREPGASRGAAIPWDFASGTAEVFLVRGAGAHQGRLLVHEIQAHGGISVDHPKKTVGFRGSSCVWNRIRQTLRLYSDDRARWQIFHHVPTGAPRGAPRDEITAREVSLVRVPAVAGVPAHVNVLFEGVTEATFHHRNGEKGRPGSGEFRLDRADHLMVMLRESGASPTGSGNPSLELYEARAWGVVHFQGSGYDVYASQCLYRSADETLAFFGERTNPVRVHGAAQLQGSAISARKTARGYTIEKKGRYPWRAEEIRRLVDEHQRQRKEGNR